MSLDPELLASMGLVRASTLDAPDPVDAGERDTQGSAEGGGPRVLPWSASRGSSRRPGSDKSESGPSDSDPSGSGRGGEGLDSLFEPAGSRAMKSLAQRQREVVDAEALAAGKPRWRPPSQAKPRPTKDRAGKRGSHAEQAAPPPPAPAPDWADVGAPPSWATEGELPQRVTELLDAWDQEESRAAELIAAGEEVVPAERADSKPAPEPLTPAEAEQLARAVALRLLTAMPRTRSELSQKLAERDVPEPAIEVVLDRFEELKLIDDGAFASAWVESRARSKGFARSRLKQELRRKGVGPQDVDAALEQIDGDEERERCRELALKKLGSRSLPPAGRGQEDRAERDKVLRRVLGFLARKGYPGGMAMEAARGAMDRHDQGERA